MSEEKAGYLGCWSKKVGSNYPPEEMLAAEIEDLKEQLAETEAACTTRQTEIVRLRNVLQMALTYITTEAAIETIEAADLRVEKIIRDTLSEEDSQWKEIGNG